MLNKIKNIVKGIKLNIKVAKGIASDNMPTKIYRLEMISADGVIYEYSPATLAVSGVSICGTQPIQFTNGLLVQRIIYDDLYDELSEDTKQFIVEHEKGHFDLKHDGSVRRIEDEYAADEYAALIVGKENAIKALKEMAELLATVSFSKRHKSVVEINDRIKNIELM